MPFFPEKKGGQALHVGSALLRECTLQAVSGSASLRSDTRKQGIYFESAGSVSQSVSSNGAGSRLLFLIPISKRSWWNW